MGWTLDEARALWAQGQGLHRRIGADLDHVVAQTGWIRTLGGAEAYLALAARASGVTVDRVHEAVAARELQVSPSVRGCIYLVPAADAGLSLRIAESLSRRRTARDLEKAGADPAEVEAVGEAVLSALSEGALSTQALRRALPEGAIRSLGAAGKKVGITSTLPPALRALEFQGRIVRTPIEDRLDHERYVWSIPASNPLDGTPETDEAVNAALAERFFRWAGPGTIDEFAAWSGLGKRASKAAVAGLEAIEVEGVGTCFAQGDRAVAGGGGVRLLPAMDNLFALRGSSAWVVDSAGHDVEIPIFGYGGPKPLREVNVPLMRSVFRGDRVVGLWAWDDAVVGRGFDGTEVDGSEVEAILRDLGHARVTSIDNDTSMAKRCEVVRGL